MSHDQKVQRMLERSMYAKKVLERKLELEETLRHLDNVVANSLPFSVSVKFINDSGSQEIIVSSGADNFQPQTASRLLKIWVEERICDLDNLLKDLLKDA